MKLKKGRRTKMVDDLEEGNDYEGVKRTVQERSKWEKILYGPATAENL